MPLLLRCPCGQHLRVAEQFAGQVVCCPTCKASLRVANTPSAQPRVTAAEQPRPMHLTDRLGEWLRGVLGWIHAVLLVGPRPLPTAPNGARPDYVLHGPWDIASACLIGSPLGGLFALAGNYLRLGYHAEARRVGWFALGWFLVAAFLLGLWNDRVYWLLVYGSGLAIGLVASVRMGGFLWRHRSAGGRVGDWWEMVLFCVAGYAPFLLLGYLTARPGFDGERAFGANRVVYHGAMGWEAERLGRVLQEAEYFTASSRRLVALRVRGDTLVVQFVVIPAALGDGALHSRFAQFVGPQVAAEVWPRRPVEFQFCDDRLQAHASRSIPASH